MNDINGFYRPPPMLVNNIVTILLIPAIGALYWQINAIAKDISELKSAAESRLSVVDQRFSEHEKIFADFVKVREQQVVNIQDIQTLKGVASAHEERATGDEKLMTLGREERLRFEGQINDRLTKIEGIIIDISRRLPGPGAAPPS